jgi:hypothetical protein
MARETAAERKLRHAEKIASTKNDQKLAWRNRLMTALEFASDHHWLIKVKNGAFIIESPNAEEDEPFVLEYTMPEDRAVSWNDLGMFELEIDRVKLQEEEAERKQKLRESARAKLTEEERKALGI